MSETKTAKTAAVTAGSELVLKQAQRSFFLLPDRHECLVLVDGKSFIVFKTVKTIKRKVDGQKQYDIAVGVYTIINAQDFSDVHCYSAVLGNIFDGEEIDKFDFEEEEA